MADLLSDLVLPESEKPDDEGDRAEDDVGDDFWRYLIRRERVLFLALGLDVRTREVVGCPLSQPSTWLAQRLGDVVEPCQGVGTDDS